MRKSVNFEIKDIDESKGVVQAYYSAYGNKDSDGDIILKGAATKSAKERGPGGNGRIKHFKNHDWRLVPGVLTELGEDQKGGWFVSRFAQHKGEFTQLAKDTLIEYKSGVITEHSHGLDIIKSHPEGDANVITELKLWEVSTLTAWGANEQTPVVNVKEEKDILKLFEQIEKLLSIGEFSDDYLKRLEEKHKSLKDLIHSEPQQHSEPDKFNFEKFNQFLKN